MSTATDITLAQALAETTRALAPLGEQAREEAQWLMCRCLGLSRATLLAHPEQRLEPQSRQRLAEWSERRARGEPLAYLTGEREFWSLSLHVTPAVLVPRPETELLVELALSHGGPHARALDLGTGSGAIAIAIAHERPHWNVTAIDRSPAALEVAARNAARLGLPHIRFLQGTWFAPVRTERFDLIVSNPPYVAADDPVMRGDSLAHEPREALTPGSDALASLREIIADAPAHLVEGGWLLLEHGHTQGPAVRALLVSRGFAHVVSHPDLAGHERMTQACLPTARTPTLENS